MGFYDEQIVPRFTHFALKAGAIGKIRAERLSQAYGVVLDVGFGSGLNLPHYGTAVARVLAVEPSKVARNLAEPLIASSKFRVDFAGLDGQKLSADSGSIDCVVTAWTLCTIPDPEIALNEFARVLKPEGQYLFMEHGLAPDEGVARWQNRLDRLQGLIAGGCHLNRPVEMLIASSALQIESLKKFYFQGPRTHSYFYSGIAGKRKG